MNTCNFYRKSQFISIRNDDINTSGQTFMICIFGAYKAQKAHQTYKPFQVINESMF